jgi:anti-sigma-K factor RskA
MDERVEELFPLYALGGLSGDERRQVETYVAAHPEARARLDELIETASAVPFSAPPVDPPPMVKRAVMARVRADAVVRRVPPHDAQPSWWMRGLRALRSPALAGASLAIAVLAIAWAITLNAEVGRLREATVALQRELAAQRDVIGQISAPGVQVMAIAGTPVQPDARGQLIANPDSRSAVLILSGLAALEPGRVYQFWLIRSETPVSAGTFEVDEQGRAVLTVEADTLIGTFDAMGVSIEPEGGSPQPTGAIVMLGEVS